MAERRRLHYNDHYNPVTMYPCPRCGAEEDELCTQITGSGYAAEVHKSRIQKYAIAKGLAETRQQVKMQERAEVARLLHGGLLGPVPKSGT